MRGRGDRNFGIRWLRDLLCGVLIGAGAILPGGFRRGAGGGVRHLPSLYGGADPSPEAIPKYWRWFLPIGLGCAIGFLGFAKGIAAAIDVSSTVTTWLFIGLIVGTVPSLFRETGKEGRSIGSWVSMAVCAGAIFFSLFYVGKVICVTVEPNFWWYNFCGALWGMSLVIPGLTSSSVMMALGLYQPMLEGLARLDFLVLSACLPGMVLTILLLARLVSWFFRKHYSIAFHGIFGIVLASTLVIIPTSYVGAWENCAVGGLLHRRLFCWPTSWPGWTGGSRRTAGPET